MKKITLLTLFLLFISSSHLLAQTYWRLGGNTVSSSQRLGTNNNYSLIFETNGSDRGRITGSGNWGIGTTDPNSKLHVNSTVSGQIPLRVQVLGSTKFLLHNNGGIAIGVNVTPPTNGLMVAGNAAIGTTTTTTSDYRLKVVGNGVGIYGEGSTPETGIGVYGRGSYIGVTGFGDKYGVEGYSDDNEGGFFASFNGNGLRATTYNGFYAAVFEGDTYTSGTAYQSSDKNIKKNIQEMSNALSIINKLKPKHYEFRNDGKYASLHLPKGNHFGLLAQDVEEVLPELVRETAHNVIEINSKEAGTSSAGTKLSSRKPDMKDSKESITIKGVNYTEMIPLLIKAVQEQQQIIQQQQQEIDAFKERFAKLESGTSTGSTIKLIPADVIGVSLGQNHPNPTNSNTTFRYTIPNDANAQILVYNSTSGKLVKTLQAPASGQVEMDAADLETGTYIYTLVVNGKQAAAKQMVLSK